MDDDKNFYFSDKKGDVAKALDEARTQGTVLLLTDLKQINKSDKIDCVKLSITIDEDLVNVKEEIKNFKRNGHKLKYPICLLFKSKITANKELVELLDNEKILFNDIAWTEPENETSKGSKALTEIINQIIKTVKPLSFPETVSEKQEPLETTANPSSTSMEDVKQQQETPEPEKVEKIESVAIPEPVKPLSERLEKSFLHERENMMRLVLNDAPGTKCLFSYSEEVLEAMLKSDSEKTLILTDLDGVLFPKVRGYKVWFSDTDDCKWLEEALKKFNPQEFKRPFVLLFETKEIEGEIITILENADFKYASLDWKKLKEDKDGTKSSDKRNAEIEIEIDKIADKAKIEPAQISEYIKNWKTIAKDFHKAVTATGFKSLDEQLGGGLLNGNLYALGSMSSLGKTTLALNIAHNIANGGKNVLFFSLEMRKDDLVLKGLCRLHNQEIYNKNKAEIANSKQQTWDDIDGLLSARDIMKDWEGHENKLSGTLKAYENQTKHLYIVEGFCNIGTKEIRDTINRCNKYTENKPSVVIIDYLQYLTPFDTRYSYSERQNIDTNIAELKRMAVIFNIPIIVLSSFNRTNYMTEVSFESFKDSGKIEYTSDILMGLQLKIPEREGWDRKTTEDEKKRATAEAKKKFPREIELVILKNRMYQTYITIGFNYFTRWDFFVDTDTDNGNNQW
jgi:replicative DNA helicase